MHSESYSVTHTNRLADELAELVNRKSIKKHLKQVRPDKLERYGTVNRAAETIAAVVLRDSVLPRILYDDDSVVAGIGTIVRTMSVARSVNSGFRLRGRHIDYFADPEYGLEFHQRAASSLAGDGDYKGPVIATLTAAETMWAPGIPATMIRTGGPGRLVEVDTDFGLSSISEPLQAYFGHVGASGQQ